MLAFALRLYRLSASGFWFDEAASYFIASKGLLGIVEYARQAPGEHPPLYYMLLSLWMSAAGASEFVLRFFSVFFGVLFVALFYRFLRHHFDERLARWTTVLSVPLPFLVDYSQEARMYTLVLCATVLALDAFLRWVRGERRAALWYGVFVLVALSIHYYA
ncbi:MAG: glycosyltransferase family 39 protein, partial [Chloroflexi bacterium]|nr:glycosyltransferase family 39 protein [Chloroflexota bacterium]